MIELIEFLGTSLAGAFRGTVTTDGRSLSFRSKDLLEVCC